MGPFQLYRINITMSTDVGTGQVKKQDLSEVMTRFANRNFLFQATGGHFTISVNGKDGYIFFTNRVSTAHSARTLWNIPQYAPVPQDELPALRSSSDLAWGFWNRVSGHNLGNVNGFMSITVVNEDTGYIIDLAVERRGYDSLPVWPGIRFDPGTEEYNALLGKTPLKTQPHFLKVVVNMSASS